MSHLSHITQAAIERDAPHSDWRLSSSNFHYHPSKTHLQKFVVACMAMQALRL
jgi:hypothetical protein